MRRIPVSEKYRGITSDGIILVKFNIAVPPEDIDDQYTFPQGTIYLASCILRAVTTLRHEEATASSFFNPLGKVACQSMFRDSIFIKQLSK